MKGTSWIAGGLAALLLSGTWVTTALAAAPYDVQRHWSGDAVNTLLEQDVVHGYPNGRFYPDRAITREELAQLLSLVIQKVETERPVSSSSETTDTLPEPTEELPELPEPTEEPTEELPELPEPTEELPIVFSDVDESRWSGSAIYDLAERGVITGYADGTFRPQAPVTRAESASMLYRYLTKGDYTGKPVFPDVTGGFAYDAISYLSDAGILTGWSDGTFHPDASMTRGECAAMLLRASGWETVPVQVVLPEKTVIAVPYISQLYPVRAVVGCEATSLLMALHAKGYAKAVDLRKFLDEMPKSKSDPAKGFVGSPYVADLTKKTRTTIYPPILAQYASQYGEVVDFSGSSPEDIQFELLNGNPVVIYATMRWETPFYRWYTIEGAQQRLLSNNHAVLACGYNSKTDEYYIADPYNISNQKKEYTYWIAASKLEPIYLARRHAVVVR